MDEGWVLAVTLKGGWHPDRQVPPSAAQLSAQPSTTTSSSSLKLKSSLRVRDSPGSVTGPRVSLYPVYTCTVCVLRYRRDTLSRSPGCAAPTGQAGLVRPVRAPGSPLRVSVSRVSERLSSVS